MLVNTFLHLPGIGKVREHQLWKAGLTSWDTYDAGDHGQLRLFQADEALQSLLSASRNAIANNDVNYFATRLPREEYYRILLSFPKQTLFVDIETTGLSRWYDYITLIGWEMDGNFGFHIKGTSAREMYRAFSSAKAIVTFNGTLFDLPFIQKEYPDLEIPQCHVDLRFFVRRVQISGGQKAVEKSLGIQRSDELKRITGEAAPVLWHKYCRGDLAALKLLVNYNQADIRGLEQILDLAVERRIKEDEIPVDLDQIPHFYKPKRNVLLPTGPDDAVNTYLTAYTGDNGPTATLVDLAVATDCRVVGIDLTGSESRPSGWSLIQGSLATTQRIGSDEDLIRETLRQKPQLISIDSPLSLPRGRNSVDDDDVTRQSHGIMRECERILKRRGVNVYPCLIPSMQRLTERGMRLANRLRAKGVPVIESYPGAAQDILRIPRKRAGLEFLADGLHHFGLEGEFTKGSISHDELDAITSALVGLFFWAGRFEALGNPQEDYLIVPDVINKMPQWGNRIVIGLSGPIASGKTTAGNVLRNAGFVYARYSQIIQEIAVEQGLDGSRESLQQVGQKIHVGHGQRLLGRRLLDALPASANIVVDGLRHPEDHSFWIETFGPDFYHVSIQASVEACRRRYLVSHQGEPGFELARAHPVESNIPILKQLANEIIVNEASLDTFTERISRLAQCLILEKSTIRTTASQT